MTADPDWYCKQVLAHSRKEIEAFLFCVDNIGKVLLKLTRMLFYLSAKSFFSNANLH